MTTNQSSSNTRALDGEDTSFVFVRIPHVVFFMLREAFLVSVVTYAVFIVIDQIVPGFVSRVFRLDILLGAMIVLGIITVTLAQRAPEKLQEAHLRHPAWITTAIIVSGSITALIIWLRTASLGWINLPLSVMSGLIVAGLTWFFLDSETFPDQDSSH